MVDEHDEEVSIVDLSEETIVKLLISEVAELVQLLIEFDSRTFDVAELLGSVSSFVAVLSSIPENEECEE